MNNIRVDVIGYDKLVSQLKKLSDQNKKPEVLAILRQVAKPTLDAARAFTPISKKPHTVRGVRVNPGQLKKSEGIITGRRAVNPTVYVGPRAKGSWLGFYGLFVHEGVNVYRKGFKRKRIKGANASGSVGRTQANPFLTKAYNATNGSVTADAEKRMEKFIQRKIDKLS